MYVSFNRVKFGGAKLIAACDSRARASVLLFRISLASLRNYNVYTEYSYCASRSHSERSVCFEVMGAAILMCFESKRCLV